MRLKFPFLPSWFFDFSDTPLAVRRTNKSWFGAVRLHTKYKQLYPQRYYLIKFEDLISEPEKQSRQICDFLNIPFESKMLEEVVVVGSSYQSQQRGSGGFDQQSLERWRKHLNLLAKAWFTIRARKQLKQFGYVP